MIDYVRDAAEIYRRSIAAIRREADLDSLPADLQPLALRLVHACGMPEIVADLMASPYAASRGVAALLAGAPILTDVEMVAHGIDRARLPSGNAVICTLNDDTTREAARRLGTTRSAAAIEGWRDTIDSAVVAIGNAPTALFHLLERLEQGWPSPAVILGFSVGFVGAAESKEALAAQGAVPYIALKGRRGGSAMAAAAVNALAQPDALAQ
ncbi:MAG: precorrin-8X methylmutase [Alphaproteobacteria bacterium]|nr:precorrin-8X methylmutase [Alphaproteobacteria bacterium]